MIRVCVSLGLLLGLVLGDEEYIIAGKDVTIKGKYPFMGSLKTYGGHKCGIALISKRWGVTSAYCVNGETVNDLKVMLGSNKRRDEDADIFPVKSFIMHEKYKDGSGNNPNDIAVVEFLYDVTGPNIATVPLATKGSEHTGNNDCWIMGYGDTGSDDLSDILQEAKMDVITQAKCKEFWVDDVSDGHVCVKDPASKATPCDGDSGGPLVCKVNGRYELVGVRSWGIVNCWTFVPSVYTRVSQYTDWIKQKTGV